VGINGIHIFWVPLSTNISKDPNDGTLICRNAVIGRTGRQLYRAGDIADELERIGIPFDPSDWVTVYRSHEEVFSRRTIASFEGKPVTDGHPDQLLTVQTISQYQCGHVQNVCKGSEALDTGDWPLLADLVITSEDLINRIVNGLRELGCGYNYKFEKDGDRILQTNIIGNHVAAVETGRAGKLASIRDSADIDAMRSVAEWCTNFELQQLVASFPRKQGKQSTLNSLSCLTVMMTWRDS
jgi:uncharacterized protein